MLQVLAERGCALPVTLNMTYTVADLALTDRVTIMESIGNWTIAGSCWSRCSPSMEAVSDDLVGRG